MQNEFPNAKNVCYLNTAAEGLLPLSSVKAIQEAAQWKVAPQDLGDHQYYELPRSCRALIAKMLHCGEKEIGLCGSTSYGMQVIASSLPLKGGDEVLLVEPDHPANNHSWEGLRSKGVQLNKIPIIPDAAQTGRVIESISAKTRVVSISAVHFFTGYRYDLRVISEYCRSREIFLIVDAIQAVGSIELDLSQIHIDALVAAGHKWQLCCTGTGFLYVHPDLMPRLITNSYGWLSAHDANSFAEVHSFDYSPATGARRFELGTTPYLLWAAYEQGLKILSESRVPYIEEHNAKLVLRLRDFFADIGWKNYDFPKVASIFSIMPPEKYDPNVLRQALADKDIFVAVREGHLRVSPHLYNTTEDINRFCEELRKLL